MKKIINSFLVVSIVALFAIIPLRAGLNVALVINETGGDITLECGDYVLRVPAAQRGRPFHFEVPFLFDSSTSKPSVGNDMHRVYFWRRGTDLVGENSYFKTSSVLIKNMNVARSGGLLIHVRPDGIFFRLLADFEVSPTGTIYA